MTAELSKLWLPVDQASITCCFLTQTGRIPASQYEIEAIWIVPYFPIRKHDK